MSDLIDIGTKLKQIRKNAKMNIHDLSIKADVSASMISQIERNLVSPSVTVLYKLATALSVSVGFLFGEEPLNTNPVVRKNNRKKLHLNNSNGVYELLTPDTDRQIEFLYIALKPQEKSYIEPITHEGEECGYVIKGQLLVIVGQNEYFLSEGDSISFKSSIPHHYLNVGDIECISVWAMTPPSF
jgi:transcriptional regulator with XRE-family HTH domain